MMRFEIGGLEYEIKIYVCHIDSGIVYRFLYACF